MTRNQAFWAIVAVVLLGACIWLGVLLGWGATGIMLVALIFPDLSLIGAFANRGRLRPERVTFYNALHSLPAPIVLMVIGAVLGATNRGTTLLIFALTWITHIAIDRAIGYRLRAADGSIRPLREPNLKSA